MWNDTIIALSTPMGHSGIGVVRLSGSRSLSIAKKMFRPKKCSHGIPSLRPVLGNVHAPGRKDFFEEAYLTFFPKPYTYTREDMVEISCHGSPVILEEIIRLGIQSGARPANPGEFTLRAYMNGRIDIIQAEAINSMIHASSLKQAKMSFNQMEGSLSRKVSDLRNKIIHLLAQVEASIEFPEEKLKITPPMIAKTISKISKSVQTLLASYEWGKTLSEGLTLVITGRANVGKSTLFNALLERDRAIVTPYPGTTRDYIQEKIKINDALFILTDMAGIDIPSHPVEKEGIKRGKKLAAAGDGILLLLDASRKETSKDRELMRKYSDKKTLLLFNKIDLPVQMDLEKMTKQAPDIPVLEISALKGTHLDRLKTAITDHFIPSRQKHEETLLHLRQKLLFEHILSYLTQAKQLMDHGHSEEIWSEEIRKILPLIGELTGEIRDENIIEDIFSRFCVGK